MTKLSKVDARLLESLEVKYGTDELVTAIQSITPSIAQVLTDKTEEIRQKLYKTQEIMQEYFNIEKIS